MNTRKFFSTCSFLILLTAPTLVFGQAATKPAATVHPGPPILQQSVIQAPSAPAPNFKAPVQKLQREQLTRQLERRRSELHVRREDATAPAPPKPKN